MKRSINNIKCSNCGHTATLATADANGIRYYECQCGARCKAINEGKGWQPYGQMALKDVRQLRIRTHDVFDKIWKFGYMTREMAYRWLASVLGMTYSTCHIRNFSEFRCNQTISVALNYLNSKLLTA